MDERKWLEWEPAFMNYLMMIPGINGIPLSYIVREEEVPTEGATDGRFNEHAIACVPLSGDVFQTNEHKMYQLLKSFCKPRRWSNGSNHLPVIRVEGRA